MVERVSGELLIERRKREMIGKGGRERARERENWD